MNPRLTIHGGAGKRPTVTRRREVEKALDFILGEAYRVLLEMRAVEAVVHAVSLLEDNPLFNAGTGAELQADGKARLTASLMDGERQRFSAVVNIERVKNPITVAYHLQKEKFTVLAGREAIDFARSKGLGPYNPVTKERLAEWQKHREAMGTVGAVAIDSNGNIASATSTGGAKLAAPGRVSDVASPCGTYADKYVGVSVSGRGEDIINVALAARVGIRVRDGMGLREAMEFSLKELSEIGGMGGLIAMDREGHALCLHNTQYMAYTVK